MPITIVILLGDIVKNLFMCFLLPHGTLNYKQTCNFLHILKINNYLSLKVNLYDIISGGYVKGFLQQTNHYKT